MAVILIPDSYRNVEGAAIFYLSICNNTKYATLKRDKSSTWE